MSRIEEVRVPDIGDFDLVDVIEVLVTPGSEVHIGDSLITLESDKASMEVPSPAAGLVREVKVAVGDKVGKDSPILTLEVWDEQPRGEQTVRGAEPPPPPERTGSPAGPAASRPPAAAPPLRQLARHSVDDDRLSLPSTPPISPTPPAESGGTTPHASPSVRRFARELGADLARITGTGRKGRILRQDVHAFVKAQLDGSATTDRPRPGVAAGLADLPRVDFSKFGTIDVRPINRIRKLSAAHVHRSWLHVPHVTQFDEADITDMEAFRKANAREAEQKGFKLTPLAFLMKACVGALKEFPEFNSSLDPTGENLILKKYFHIAVAVDTPDGLVVPVIRNVDCKGIFDLAAELAAVSMRAREGKLTLSDIQGGSFTISSLGGIGGTAFTPIVNAPEVAILGVSRARWQPVYHDDGFVPRLILPFALSYDHRVIDGAAAVRFTTYLGAALSDVRRLVL